MSQHRLKARARLGKYRIVRKIGEGAFASVYRAHDTIEGIDVALKIPHGLDPRALEDLRREVRLTAKLEHPHILPIKNAEQIGDLFVIACPLGIETLGSRLGRRLSPKTALEYSRQMLSAVGYAHDRRIIHCDIKPENLILFANDRLRLGDFGIAKVALRTVLGSGQGTVGYVAPEQALGKPSLRSDVFSLGLVMYRMFSGELPEWPYRWPPRGITRARRVLSQEFLDVLQRCIAVDDSQRYPHARALFAAVDRLKGRALRSTVPRTRPRVHRKAFSAWRSLRAKEFARRYRRELELRASCAACGGPTSESMLFCPFCAKPQRRYNGPSRFPSRCKRCRRSAKRDFRFCAYCYGAKIQEPSKRSYSDRRYTSRCSRCRGRMMPFMRYCPSCRSRATQHWPVPGSRQRCPRCHWGVVKEFWDHCPWCAQALNGGRR